jgi:hypothetical protein
MAETPIVSDTLQKEFRDNFPSQISSGRDLHVSDTIIPIVDFSTTVGTSGIDTSLQQAFDFNVTSFAVNNTNTTIINTTGFWRIQYAVALDLAFNGAFGASSFCGLQINDGSSTKDLINFTNIDPSIGAMNSSVISNDQQVIVFVKTGASIIAKATDGTTISGSCRQIADISGTLVNPDGYTGS